MPEKYRNERRDFNDNKTKEIVDLINKLNYFCFHGSGADDNCVGCCFEGNAPCPLHVFYTQLVDKLPH